MFNLYKASTMLAGNTQYTKVLVPFSFDGQQAFEQMRKDVIEVQRDYVFRVADIRTVAVYYLRNTTKSRGQPELQVISERDD